MDFREGVNVVLGGGDIGKTTILDAVSLLLSPVKSANLSDTDYQARDVAAGFAIEAVLSLPPESGIINQSINTCIFLLTQMLRSDSSGL